MDSIKAFNGYGRVVDQNHLELKDEAPNRRTTNQNQKRKSLMVTISVFGILLLTLTLGLMLQALIHESNTEEPELDENPSLLSSIKAVCNVTRFPNSCFTSIASAALKVNPNGNNYSNPVAIFKLSLHVSIKELSGLSSSLKTLASNSNGAAVRDCESQIEDSLSRLNDSVLAMLEVGPAEKVLTEKKINDIQTWISAAVTDEETCLDGLEETGSSVLDEVKRKMQMSKECTSNSLAIVANINTILDKFHMSQH